MPAAPIPRTDIDIANRGAENFIKLYYAAYDSSNRAETVSRFYRPSSTFNWNGTSVTGVEEIKDFLSRLPQSKHEVQSSDCHAVPGIGANASSDAPPPPSLLIVISGTVSHWHGSTAPDPNWKNINNTPRTFSQTFLMIPDVPAPIGVASEPKYYVATDTMRFVG